MLKSRIAYHHSGLSYGARAGIIEPLAKAGQLRVVVATMGLAAGINFSLRSVAIAAGSYRRDGIEQPLKADEILQMFGRAGRRGLDETGFVLITANELRLLDARPAHLARSGAVDWSALLSIMTAAAQRGRDPFTEAVRTQERLFTTKPIFLGVEESLKHPDVPCGLKTDAERARHVRKNVREMLNSAGDWQRIPPPAEVPLKNIRICTPAQSQATATTPGTSTTETAIDPSENSKTAHNPLPLPEGPRSAERSSHLGELTSGGLGKPLGRSEREGDNLHPTSETTANALPPSPLNGERAGVRGENNLSPQIVNRPALSEPAALEKSGTGTLCVLSETDGLKTHGRSLTVADRLADDRVVIAKWVRRLTDWNGRQAPLAVWTEKIVPILEAKLAHQKTPVVRFVTEPHRILAHVSIGDLTLRVPIDSHGVALWKPVERDVLHDDCARCSLIPACQKLSAATGTALLWRRLGLVDAQGVPTRRGQIVSYFSHGDGLAIAAALERFALPA